MKCQTLPTILAIMLLGVTKAFAQGTLINDNFYSPALGEQRLVQVYLPEGYNDPGNTGHYPMVMFLHGLNCVPSTSWYSPTIVPQLDTLIANGWINPTIVAFPDASTTYFTLGPYQGGSWYVNSELYGSFEDFIIEDVVNHIDATYRTLAISNRRCVSGHSMGGHGSMMLAVKHPDHFKGVVSHSGLLDWENWPPTMIPTILSENGGSAPYTFNNPYAGPFTWFTFTAAGAFSPNLANPPWYVDFPLDDQGDLIEPVFDIWLENNSAALVEALEPGELDIFFDHGAQDWDLPCVFSETFADKLDSLGLEYTFQLYTGGHVSPWRYPIGFMWLDSVMQSTSFEPFEVTLIPENPPIQIPASGGGLNYNIAVGNNTDSTVICDVWCNVTLPNGAIYGPVLGPANLTLVAGFSANRDRTQNVPGGAPPGAYSFNAYIGIYPNIVWNMDTFPFEKLAIGAGARVIGWANYGKGFEVWITETDVEIPKDIMLLGNYPNPFNPSTTISFTLPEASYMKLQIFNVAGRLVESPLKGWRDAGYHEVTFNASNLASGLYFYRIEAGDFSAVKKMVLVK